MDKIVIYGKGKFFNEYKNELEKIGQTVAFVCSNCKNNDDNSYNKIEDVKEIYDKVVIMVSRISICFEIINNLLKAGIDSYNIILGISKWGDYSSLDRIEVTEKGGILLSKNGIDIEVSNEDEFQNVIDTILRECYKYFLQDSEKEVVFDVGMNVGDSTVYFAKMKKVIKVYAFEPFNKTFRCAEENIVKNDVQGRTCLFDFGLSDHNEKMTLLYNNDMSCGQSTCVNNNEIAYKLYEELELIDKSKDEKEIIEIKKVSSVFDEIFNEYSDQSISFVLKMDCEGEEFSIIRDLNKSGMLNHFSLIMLEWHYRLENEIIELLEKNGFSFHLIKKTFSPYMGLLYAWK